MKNESIRDTTNDIRIYKLSELTKMYSVVIVLEMSLKQSIHRFGILNYDRKYIIILSLS